MGSFSITHWLILLAVVVVIFGTSKLKNAGRDLGSAVKGFKDAVKEEDERTITKKQLTDINDKPVVISKESVIKNNSTKS